MSGVELIGWAAVVFIVAPFVGNALGKWINKRIGGDDL